MKDSLCKGLLVGLFFLVSQVVNAASFRDYSYLDPDKIVPVKLLQEAVTFYDANLDKIENQRVMGVIDYKQHNSKERFYVIDMESGRVETYLTAHGKNSDPNFDGYATKFSNVPDSNTTSLGFFLTAEAYYGKNGYSLRLDGLSKSNSNARVRAIVIHGAEYVTPGSKIGRSYGCPAVEMRYHKDLIDQIKGGALLYAGLGL
jgi:hypothetical protein